MSITTEDLKSQFATIRELRELDEQSKAARAKTMAVLEEAEEKMLAMLQEAGIPSFKCEFGGVGITMRMSVQTPKTPEDRTAFFDHLKKEGLFDSMITVNSQTLTSYYKDCAEKAREEGREDFKIPGLLKETMKPILWVRKP